MCKLKIMSDFKDYYDHYFDNCDFYNDIECFVFKRYSKTSRSRQEDFEALKKAGFYTPKCGIISLHNEDLFYKLYDVLNYNNYIVIYDDAYSHKGENKRLITSLEEIDFVNDDGKFWSQYIPSNYAYHWRLLTIGDFYCMMKYTSDHSWMSNLGDVIISIVQYGLLHDVRLDELKNNLLCWPLIAVDGRYYEGNFVAFDLNTAPQLEGTGIEYILKPKDVVDYIKLFFDYK